MKSKRARQESTSDSDASEDSVLSVDNSSESEDSGSSSEDLKRSKKKKKRAASSESDSDSETHHKRSAKKRKHKKKKKKHSKKKRRHESHEESDVEITSASDGEVYIRKRHKHHKHKHSSKGPKKSHDSSAKDSEKYEYRDDGNKEQRYYSTVQSVVKDKHVSSVENISSDEDRELKSHRSHASEKYFSKDYNYRREEAKPRDVGPSRGRHHDVDGDRRVEEMHRFYRGSSKDRTRSADGRDREREPFPYDRTQHKKFDADKPGVRYDKDSYEQKYSERYQGGYQGQGYQKSRHQDYGVTESRTCPEKVDNRYQQSRPDRYDNPRPSNDMDMQRHKPRYDDDYRGKDRGYNSRYNANSGPPSDSRYDPKPSVQHRDYQNRQYQSNQSSFRNDRDYYNKGQKEDIRSIPSDNICCSLYDVEVLPVYCYVLIQLYFMKYKIPHTIDRVYRIAVF